MLQPWKWMRCCCIETQDQTIQTEHLVKSVDTGSTSDVVCMQIHIGENPSVRQKYEETMKELQQENAKHGNTILKLRMEAEAYDKKIMCIICMEREKSAYFLPCGHAALCMKCASPYTVCVICESNVDFVGSIYMM